jgi:hypothetical protein
VSGHKLALHMADTSDRRNNADLSIDFSLQGCRTHAARTPIATAVPQTRGSKPCVFMPTVLPCGRICLVFLSVWATFA